MIRTMNGSIIAYLLILCSLLLPIHVVRGAESEQSTIRIAATVESIQPGTILPLTVQIIVADGWHTYAEEPGDSGMAPSFQLLSPDNLTLLPWTFPPPKTFTDKIGTTYGYEKSVTLTGGVLLPKSMPATTPLELKFKLSWMICREVCIFLQDEQTVTITLHNSTREPVVPGKETP